MASLRLSNSKNPLVSAQLPPKTLCAMLKGTGGMVLFAVTGKGNPAQLTLLHFMEGGPGDE